MNQTTLIYEPQIIFSSIDSGNADARTIPF